MSAEVTLTEVLEIFNQAFQNFQERVEDHFNRIEERFDKIENTMATKSQMEKLVEVLEANKVISPYEASHIVKQTIETSK